MKKYVIGGVSVIIITVLIFFLTTALAGKSSCADIRSGTIYTEDGQLITTGVDEWGYNYQTHSYSQTFCKSQKSPDWCDRYQDSPLTMKWNDAYLSNKDCDADGLLDKHYGYPTYVGSGAWITNSQKGSYTMEDGTLCIWDYYVKIAAVPTGATLADTTWNAADGTILGQAMWQEFYIAEQIYTDSCTAVTAQASKKASPAKALR